MNGNRDEHPSVTRQRETIAAMRVNPAARVLSADARDAKHVPCVHRGDRLEDQLCDGCKSTRKPTPVWWCDLLERKCALRRLMEPGDNPVKRDGEVVICLTCEKYVAG